MLNRFIVIHDYVNGVLQLLAWLKTVPPCNQIAMHLLFARTNPFTGLLVVED